MSKRENLSGRRFGRLIAIDYAGTKSGQTIWNCICDCGKKVQVTAGHLKSQHTLSCGCYNKERTRNSLTTHGKTGTRLHNIWFCMKQRCYNTNHDAYPNYGGRGISVCDDWLNDFEKFYDWAVNNGYTEKLSIDRIDVNSNYCPENCRWSTRNEQNLNKRTNHYITHNGETLSIREWEIRLGFKRGVISARINKLHWSEDLALTTPTHCKTNIEVPR